VNELYHTLCTLFIRGVHTGEGKKKKKKKKPKKKKPVVAQTDPPRIGLSKFFPNGHYPEGEIQEYTDE
jgi:methionyl aminopeptidase